MSDSTTMAAITVDWLGQAGFVLTGGAGVVAIDPYLSDLCRDVIGLERLSPAPCTPSEVGADLVLVSHWHEDHLDTNSAREFFDAGAVFVGPPSCMMRLSWRGIPASALVPLRSGESYDHRAIRVTALPARHEVAGAITEDAVGFLVQMDDRVVYHSGDTEYDRRLLAARDAGPIDLALLCCNGTGGNMNASEAACLAAQLDAKMVVPMHFGMWNHAGYGAGGTLDPADFVDVYRRLAPEAAVIVPRIHQPITLG